MELQEYNREQLLYIIQEQNKQIHTLTADQAWLIEENNLQRETVAKCQQKITEWQSYAQYRKAQAETLAQQVKEKEKSEASLKSAVEELGALKNEHLALLGKYETIKQQLDYGIQLGRAMYEEYLAYKTSYFALLQQFNTTTEDTEDSKITLQEQETPEPTMNNNAYAVVQYNKRKTAPPEAWSDFIINIKVPSSAKIRLTVNIRNEPPSLHCAWRWNPHKWNPTKGTMLALPAVVSNQVKVVEKRGFYEQHVWGVLRSPVKASDTECQNDRGTKSSAAGEQQKVDRPSGKVNIESSEILHSKLSLKTKAHGVFHFLSLLKTTSHLDGRTNTLLEFLE